ncbi:glycosyltransferase family 4 protein [bacterium]|nr:glycosyltransferase family 4 protein [bacterium]
MKKFLLVTNFCPFYRIKLYKILNDELKLRILFYSRGTEKYWEASNAQGKKEAQNIYLAEDGANKLVILWRYVKVLFSSETKGVIQGFNGAAFIFLGYLIARLRGIPFGIWTGLWYHPRTTFHNLTRPLTDFIYRHADFAIVYGTHVKAYLVSRGMKEELIFIAQNTADNELYAKMPTEEEKRSFREKYGLAENEPALLYVGRFSAEKGPKELLKALKLVKDPPKLIMIGKGPEKEWCENFARENDLPVTFAGYVANEELYRYYNALPIVVIPSVDMPELKEAWSLTVNECMNQGCVAIATESVGAAAGGLVEDGKTGFIVPERDPEKMAAAIEKLVADKELRETFSKNAKTKIATWDYDHMAEGFRQAVALMEEKLRR